MDSRDSVWGHPDLMPTADDLDDPADYVRRVGAEFTLPELGDGAEAPGDDEPQS
jgi:hypothetical protein